MLSTISPSLALGLPLILGLAVLSWHLWRRWIGTGPPRSTFPEPPLSDRPMTYGPPYAPSSRFTKETVDYSGHVTAGHMSRISNIS